MTMKTQLQRTEGSPFVRPTTVGGTCAPSQPVHAGLVRSGGLDVTPSPGRAMARPGEGGVASGLHLVGSDPDDATLNRAERRGVMRRRRAAPGEDLLDREAGMATAEYAIATLAAVGFAALLVAVLSSSQIKGLLTSLITTALNFG